MATGVTSSRDSWDISDTKSIKTNKINVFMDCLHFVEVLANQVPQSSHNLNM